MIYRLLLIFATLIWGSSFVIVKDVTDHIDPTWIIVVRFAVAAIILALALAPKRRKLYLQRDHILFGLLFGMALGSAYLLQTFGIMYTTPGKNAFLTGVYCVLVPFFAWAITKNRPTSFNIIAAVLCIVGIGFVSLGSINGLNVGDALTLLCAVFYAIHICLVSKFAVGRDIYVLTMWQFVGVTLLALVMSLATGASPASLATLEPAQYGQLAYLAVGCTTLALLFQNIGQANIPPASASLLLSLESPFGVAFSVAFGAEVITEKILLGFILIFAAIIISEVLPEKLGRKPSTPTSSDELSTR